MCHQDITDCWESLDIFNISETPGESHWGSLLRLQGPSRSLNMEAIHVTNIPSPCSEQAGKGSGLWNDWVRLLFWWPCGLGLTSWRGCVRQDVSLRTTVISDTHASLWSPWVTGTSNCLCWWGKTALLLQPRKGWLMLGCLSDGGDLQGLVS